MTQFIRICPGTCYNNALSITIALNSFRGYGYSSGSSIQWDFIYALFVDVPCDDKAFYWLLNRIPKNGHIYKELVYGRKYDTQKTHSRMMHIYVGELGHHWFK